MKTYIALTNSLELRAASKLVETVQTLVNRLLTKENVLVTMLAIESKIKVLEHFVTPPTEEKIKAALMKLSVTSTPEISALADFFDLHDHKMEDGQCWVFLDQNQLLPRKFVSRVQLSYALFTDLTGYPVHYVEPTWNCFGGNAIPSTSVDNFVENCVSDLKLVNTVMISMTKGFGFVAHPFPRLPQRCLFDDPQFMYSPTKNVLPETNGCTITALQFVTFQPDTVLSTLHARGCTYILQKKNDTAERESYTNLVNHLISKQKIAIFRRSVGDYFVMRPFRRPSLPDSEYFLLIEFISTSSIKFVETANKAKQLPFKKFRKHVFSYDGHTSFANTERTELALNRIGRLIRREADDALLKRELLLAGRHMAVSCHKELGFALAGMFKDYLETGGLPLETQHLFNALMVKLNQENGIKAMIDYLEGIVPQSKIKVGKY